VTLFATVVAAAAVVPDPEISVLMTCVTHDVWFRSFRDELSLTANPFRLVPQRPGGVSPKIRAILEAPDSDSDASGERVLYLVPVRLVGDALMRPACETQDERRNTFFLVGAYATSSTTRSLRRCSAMMRFRQAAVVGPLWQDLHHGCKVAGTEAARLGAHEPIADVQAQGRLVMGRRLGERHSGHPY
jgi:hypothetical protein